MAQRLGPQDLKDVRVQQYRDGAMDGVHVQPGLHLLRALDVEDGGGRRRSGGAGRGGLDW